ncbi:catalase [Jonesia denitrificans]|uniref:Catalase n=1 Tax=Jonesia denitrificans (strain ATCC 14870 / DSM 20603 / BCRC 15368 / CIP 55.134 / JCM 11481 / NBRC 15587 / NCTC 10816 / Prevot 55134) TaxID=471856 RepID=C7R3Q0_JONDD|nr:catalase [Jonesia denitrificans]ACV08757.1 Catalase [Jonesia denitrificans DSM 20603]ASE09919.1 catalase [Jonesia denitrificans]QXB42256.1 catalase [Jonesia denitrificans]SQH20746.1 Catalase [Jonesia denitrificans]
MTEQPTTAQNGSPIASSQHSLTTGPDGVTALHDRFLVEKLASFNRERVPERNPHAKGGGAFGEFVVTEDVTRYTKAAVFQPGATTETLLRFSSVAGEQGSPDTWRDVRGFALRYYTTEGNFDIVGNNTPIFFIRDAIKFPDFIHSQKRNGKGLRDSNMQWDFWTLSPESAHQVTYLMGDRGLPKTWRHMNGYGSHTYSWANEAGEQFWVKYHFVSRQGVESMTNDEAERLAGTDADFYRRDLFDAIDRGDNPVWDMYVQVMPYEDAKTYHFNPFDLTKIWSFSDYPRIKVGELTLNRNPRNFFQDIEQAAFSPSNLVPGTGISPDKMLMGRMFAYPDAQRYRIGTNYNQLPVNQPHAAEVVNYQHEGNMRYVSNDYEVPVHNTNSLGYPEANEAAAGEVNWETDGPLLRAAYTLRTHDDDFGQAGTLYREVFTDDQRSRFIDTLTGQGKSISRPEVRERFFGYWGSVDSQLGQTLRERVGQ